MTIKYLHICMSKCKFQFSENRGSELKQTRSELEQRRGSKLKQIESGIFSAASEDFKDAG